MTDLVRYHCLVLAAFSRQGARTCIAYTAAYWMELLNTAIRVLAVVAVWSTLYRAYPQRFPVTSEQTVTYVAVTQLCAVALTWWSGAHHRIAAQVRAGTLHVDLLRPVNYPFQLMSWELGESAARIGLVVLPAAAATLLLPGVVLPAGIDAGLLFAASITLSFLLLFECNFLVGLLVFHTLHLKGVQHTYHALITLLSGLWLPLWLYPSWLAALTELLPLRSIFYTPAAVYVGYLHEGAAMRALAVQALWAAVLWIAVQMGWRGTRAALTAQGG